MSNNFPTRALSIRQPWAYNILFDGKDVENRTWRTDVRGPILIHAGKRPDGELRGDEPQKCHLGGIVGMAEIVDCVSQMESDWFRGPYGFVLRNPQPLEFIPCPGKLGFFKPEFDRSLLKVLEKNDGR